MGLTGALLVFRAELTPVFTPAVKVSPAPAPAGAYERILAAARGAAPAAGSFDIAMPLRPDRAVEVIVKGRPWDRYLFIDPHDGTVVADGTLGTGAMPVPGLAGRIAIAHEKDELTLWTSGHEDRNGLRLRKSR